MLIERYFLYAELKYSFIRYSVKIESRKEFSFQLSVIRNICSTGNSLSLKKLTVFQIFNICLDKIVVSHLVLLHIVPVEFKHQPALVAYI